MHFKCTRIAEALGKMHQITVNQDAVCLLTEMLFRYCQVLATDLECFAKHAKRTTVTVDDVLCFARRNPKLVSLQDSRNLSILINPPSFVRVLAK